jgi:CRP-like cAMP-binding protein
MSETNQKKLTLSQLIDALGDLSDMEADPELHLIELKEGEVLFEQGSEGDSMYVLIAGVLGVRVRYDDGSETVIDRLAPGC